jgi:hypothetical protein
VALAISSVSRRRSVAGSQTAVLALATLLLDVLARLWKPAQAVAWLSPFRYYSPMEMLAGRPTPAHSLAVLLGIALAGFLLACVGYSRRNL